MEVHGAEQDGTRWGRKAEQDQERDRFGSCSSICVQSAFTSPPGLALGISLAQDGVDSLGCQMFPSH